MSDSNASKKSSIKNPLLISNFAVEDFTHNAMIVAPAPPIQPAVLKQEEVHSAIFSTDSRAVIPEDSDNFSEVSLDNKADPQQLGQLSYIKSPLEDLDAPAQLNLQESFNESADQQSLPLGLSASFAQLPNVASTVFSTFSRVIKGNSPTPGEQSLSENNYQAGHGVQSAQKSTLDDLYEHQHPSQQSLLNQPFEPPHEDIQPATPTFYSPNDLSIAGQSSLPPRTNSSNTFRLGGNKKKTYAHIPGLSTSVAPTIPSASTPNLPPLPVSAQIHQPEVSSVGYFDLTAPQPYIQEQKPKQEQGNKFSLGGLLPAATQLLQKIPSVQEIAQNLTKPSEQPAYQGNNSPSFFIGGGDSPAFQTQEPLKTDSRPPLPINPLNFNTSPFLQSSPSTATGTPTEVTQQSLTQPTVDQTSSQPEADTFRPPPVFFSPGAVPAIPKAVTNKITGNPYSNSRFGKSAVYKNPSLIPSAGTQPILLPDQSVSFPSVFTPQNTFNPNNTTEGSDNKTQNSNIQSFLVPVPSVESQVPVVSQQTPLNQQFPPLAKQIDSVPNLQGPPSKFNQSILSPENVKSPIQSIPQDSTLNQSLTGTFSTGQSPVPETKASHPPLPDHQSQTESTGVTQYFQSPPATQQVNLISTPAANFQSNLQPVNQTEPTFFNLLPAQTKTDTTSVSNSSASLFNASPAPPPPTVQSFPINTRTSLDLNQSFIENNSAPSNTVTTIQPPPVAQPPPTGNSQILNPYQRKQKTSGNSVIAPTTIFNPYQQNTAATKTEVTQENISAVSSVSLGQQNTELTKQTQPLGFNFYSQPIPETTAAKNISETDSKVDSFEDLPTSYPPPLDSVEQNSSTGTGFQQFFVPVSEQQPIQPFVQVENKSVGDFNSNINSIPVQQTPDLTAKTESFENQSVKAVSDLFSTTQTSKPIATDNQNPLTSFFNTSQVPQPIEQKTEEVTKNLKNLSTKDVQNNFINTQQKVNQSDSINNNSAVIQNPPPLTTETQKCDNDIPRFTPVHFFGDTPQAQTQNQLASFFDHPVTATQDKPISQNNSFDQYFKPQEVLPQEKLVQQEVYQNTEHRESINAVHTSSFSSFRSESVSELNQDFTDWDELPEEMADEIESGKLSTAPTDMKYRPVYYHWFYKTQSDPSKAAQWMPFSMNDSMNLEEAFTKAEDDHVVHTDGGRFDVSISERIRMPVYWKGEPNEVRRCSWFYKALDARFVPYEEEVADKLEEEYRIAASGGEWHKKIPLPNGETVVFHGPAVIVHFLQSQNPDCWGSSSQPTNRPRAVKRGIDEFSIEDGEPEQIDHLLFMVHGIGKACDLKFRTIEEAVDEYRSIALQLVQSHYRNSFDLGAVGRVEVLPVSWHTELHSEVDEKIKLITLESIPKLRNFANETLLDILFYSSPIFCQHIMNVVGNTMNRLYTLFRARNPHFSGGVSIGGHSLGSLILFDLLWHQKESSDDDTENIENQSRESSPEIERPRLLRSKSQMINYTMAMAGTGQPMINYPQLIFKPINFFALGSPISMFVTVRGIDKLGLDFSLPTCEGFFNIFHPYDPVAYRCEPLINHNLSNVKPVVIPHHKGRKRMHLELKETMTRVGADIKHRFLYTFKNTLQAVYSLTSNRQAADAQSIEQEVDKVLTEHLHQEEDGARTRSDSMTTSIASETESGEIDIPLGQLNQSRRIDYVLQEAPLEFFNEYLFALTSHVCYWESEDTILFMMKEIYNSMGVQTDSQIPQHTLTIERPTASTMTPNASPLHASPDKCAKN